MTDNEFARRNDRLISERAVWWGLAVYAVSFVAATNVLGGTMPQTETVVAWKANSTGTLIFGIREQTEADDRYANHFDYQSYQTRGKLTLRSHSPFDFGWELNRRELSDPVPARTLDPRIAGLTPVQTWVPSVNQPVVPRGDGGLGITPMQIAFADQSVFVGEELGLVPEPATWIAAALVAGATAWSQRRRFTRILPRRRRRQRDSGVVFF
jgi:hypothetical protein